MLEENSLIAESERLGNQRKVKSKGVGGVLPALIPLVRDLLLSKECEVLAETANVDVGLDGFHTQHFLDNGKSREDS